MVALAVSVVLLLGAGPAWATNFGASVPDGPAAADAKYGRLDVVRIFNSGPPHGWLHRPQVVSFKLPAAEVVAGKHDARLTRWFRSAPHGVRIWWAYWHEPSDNYASNPGVYVKAWRHIVRIANRYGPRSLRATYIDMIANLAMHRWRTYYPGDRFIDVLGFDGKVHQRDGRYIPARQKYRDVLKVARRHDKPWGLAEYGATVLDGDTEGRARWMRDTARWLSSHRARFACWWDRDNGAGGTYKLKDPESIAAMRWMLGDWQR